MTQTSVNRRAKALPEQAPSLLPPTPSQEAFQADCEALTKAVAASLTAAPPPNSKAQARSPGAAAASPGANQANPSRGPNTAATGFLPPYSFIMKHVGAGPNGGAGTDEVTISRELLEFLLRCVLDHMDFDEQQYQNCNPDVAAAVKRKEMPSGREHFIKSGYFEGRTGGVRVDEAWYLARNQDVAAAKAAGKFVSGAAQYRISGANEWRVPNPQSEDAIRQWRNVLAR
jgi:hypothetical protein